jgi:ABC-type glycerol-3-phosphate transport system substrate-binding protein
VKKLFFAAVLVVMLTVGAVAGFAASPNSEATITFTLNTTGGLHPTCELTITSTKDISNYTVNGVKTEGVTTTTVTISVANGDVITVKSGTSTATYTVTGCAAPDVPGGDDHDHDGDGDSDGHHDGEDHNGDGQHTVDDHH